MPLQHIFLGFTGRINRAKYWLGILALIVLSLIVQWLIYLVFDIVVLRSDRASSFSLFDLGLFRGNFIPALLMLILDLSIFYSQLALVVKRLHDRDRSAWWLVPMWVIPWGLLALAGLFLPDEAAVSIDDISPLGTGVGLILTLLALAFLIWTLIELGFRRGTPGPNRFGADPLDQLADPPYPNRP